MLTKRIPTLLILSIYFSLNNAKADELSCNGNQIVGKIERVLILDKNKVLKAKLDTGAAMTSLSAINIDIFKRNQKDWVRFTVYNPSTNEKTIYEKPLVGYIYIRKRKEEMDSKEKYSKRPVISLSICIGNQKVNILTNLNDRTNFIYPLLIGNNVLQKLNVLIDARQEYLTNPNCTKN